MLSAADDFTASMWEAITKAIPYVKAESSTFRHWLSKFLTYYIRRKKTVF
jgi:hypothetical protein